MKSHLSILSLSCRAAQFYWRSPCLYLLLPEYSLLFLVQTSQFHFRY
jgi:hypothetical protein